MEFQPDLVESSRKEPVADLDWNEGEDEQDRQLVGKWFSKKAIRLGGFANLVQLAWGIKDRVVVSPHPDNMYVFTFDTKRLCDRILKDSPWTIKGDLLNLTKWSDRSTMSEVKLTVCEYWIQVHGVPRKVQTLNNMLRMRELVGKVVCYEDPKPDGVGDRDFVRIRVAVDITKPLLTGFWIPRPNQARVWASVRYEKLQNF